MEAGLWARRAGTQLGPGGQDRPARQFPLSGTHSTEVLAKQAAE